MRQAIQWLICVSLVVALMGCGSGKIPPIEKKSGGTSTTSQEVPKDAK